MPGMDLPRGAAEVLLLHNPRCSKSRAARQLLEERGIAFRERLYLDQPLTLEELRELRRRLDQPVREWLRSGEAAFREAGLDASSSESELLAALVARPVLLERPIVVRGGRALVGRPPERVLALFDEER